MCISDTPHQCNINNFGIFFNVGFLLHHRAKTDTNDILLCLKPQSDIPDSGHDSPRFIPILASR